LAVALFLTYNTVGDAGTFANGPVERNGHRAIICQHPKGQRWATGSEPVPDGVPRCLAEATTEVEKQDMLANEAAREQAIRNLYAKVIGAQEELPDFVVVYVGAGGSEGAIALAATLPHDRLRFVMCDCNWEGKIALLAQFGCCDGDGAQYMYCGCGGHSAMLRAVNQFLESGIVGNP